MRLSRAALGALRMKGLDLDDDDDEDAAMLLFSCCCRR
jgi:hypothetical protein